MKTPIVIVGGGLGGLACATLLARSGRRVIVAERANVVGGRAVTHVHEGYHLNLGPHAVYLGGHGARVMRALGVEVDGAAPPVSGGLALWKGRLYTLPSGFVSLVTTSLLPLASKLEFGRLLASVAKVDTTPLEDVTLRAWVDEHVSRADVRALLLAYFRVTTYCDEPDRQSAGRAIAQLQMATATGVVYPHGGWQTLVGGLSRAAKAAGVEVRTGAAVASVEHDGRARGVVLADGTRIEAAAVVLAAGPSLASSLAPRISALRQYADAAVPVRAACLDVGLRALPDPRVTFALGIDVPSYYSNHSAAARLAPPGGVLVHVARYLREGASASASDLQGELDRLQPGWRDLVVHERFLPSLTVAHDIVAAGRRRPDPKVPGVDGLFVIGDWVGDDGMLSDASLASAEHAAREISEASHARHDTALRAPARRAALA